MTADTCVPSRFTRGGFSHERKFHIPAPDGGDFTGIAYRDYCLLQSGEPVPDVHMPLGEVVSGLLVVRVLHDEGAGRVLVECPDGEPCVIAADHLTRRPA